MLNSLSDMSGSKSTPVSRVGLLRHPVRDITADVVKRFTGVASKYGIEIIDLSSSPLCDNIQLVVSIGGDGTLLSAVRTAHPADIPVWGINMGTVGYLTTSVADEIEPDVERLAKGNYSVERRTMVEAEILGEPGESTKLVALNDIVVHRKVPGGGLMSIDAELNGRYLATYEVDGLIISTPTGSTAYNLSAGGSILSPSVQAFVVTPICAHSFSARSLVVDDSSVFIIHPQLKISGETAFATADGQEVAELTNCPVRGSANKNYGCRIIIKKAERSAGLVRFNEVYFHDVLRDKLGWAKGTSHDIND